MILLNLGLAIALLTNPKILFNSIKTNQRYMMSILKIETELESILEDQICLQIPEESQQDIWKILQGYSYPAAKWMAYLNRLTLEYLILYFRQVYDCKVELATPEKPDSIWEYLTGFALTIDGKRVIVIPDETDSDEFSIPFEWVDIPEWAGEYYLAVQIRPETGWLRVFGFTTHQQIKQKAEYDEVMRTYTLPQEQIIDDIEVLLTSLAIASNQKVDVPALTAISKPQENKYLATLKQPKLYSPRLDLSPEHWATFVSDDELREKLWRMRTIESLVLQKNTEPKVTWLSLLREKQKAYGAYFIDEFMRTRDEIAALFNTEPLLQPVRAARRSTSIIDNSERVAELIAWDKSESDLGIRLDFLKLLAKVGEGSNEAVDYFSSIQENETEDLAIRREAAICLSEIDPSHRNAGIRRVQLIDITYRLKDIKLSLEVTMIPFTQDRAHVHFRLTAPEEQSLPDGLILEAIDSDGDVTFEETSEESDPFLERSLDEEYGGYFYIKVSLDGFSVRSDFRV